MVPVGLSDVPYPAHVGMAHLTGGADLVEQTLAPVVVVGEFFRQKLQRHCLAELEVVGAVHLTAATENLPRMMGEFEEMIASIRLR